MNKRIFLYPSFRRLRRLIWGNWLIWERRSTRCEGNSEIEKGCHHHKRYRKGMWDSILWFDIAPLDLLRLLLISVITLPLDKFKLPSWPNPQQRPSQIIQGRLHFHLKLHSVNNYPRSWNSLTSKKCITTRNLKCTTTDNTSLSNNLNPFWRLTPRKDNSSILLLQRYLWRLHTVRHILPRVLHRTHLTSRPVVPWEPRTRTPEDEMLRSRWVLLEVQFLGRALRGGEGVWFRAL